MNLPLTTKEVYALEGLESPVGFFLALHHLVAEGDRLVFGIYDSSPPFLAFLKHHAAAHDEYSIGWHNSFALYKDESPDAGAYPIIVSSGLILKVAEVMEENKHEHMLNHIMALRGTKPWFEFHDAFFKGGVLYISKLAGEDAVSAFASQMKVCATKVKNPYSSWGMEFSD